MQTEWQESDDLTACSKRVPPFHDWRKSRMPYSGPDGVRRVLWICAACVHARPGLPVAVRSHRCDYLHDPGGVLRCVVCGGVSP